MCGICGIADSKRPSTGLLKKMGQALSHRGPDQEGIFVDENVGLVSRRLSIIDLFSGKQPIFNETKTCVIIHNGEVYNFLKLQDELKKKGHRFRTATDTETILHLYEEYGPFCVKKLRGMFAFAIWDKKKRHLMLARDHFGIKPLHYYYKNGVFLFASEIKAILTHPLVKKKVDFPALNQYFSTAFGAVPAPKTIFKNIKKLLPGHYLVYKNNKIRIVKYWHLERTKKTSIGFASAQEKILSLINQSVKSQLIADKKNFGSFLSGGIDSTAITALAAKMLAHKLKTFSIGFSDSSFDESAYAKKAAQFIGTCHNHKYIDSKKLLEVMPRLAAKMDEPFADSSLIPTFLLAEFTRQHVKVAFSGDGGDELFAGYPTYQAHQFYYWYSKLPYCLRKRFIAPLINSLPVSFANIAFDFKLKKFISADIKNPSLRHLIWLAPFAPEEKTNLWTDSAKKEIKNKQSIEKIYDRYFRAGINFDNQDRWQYLDLKTYLGDFGLVKTDRAGSLASLEVRPPFLQVELAEFVFSLPSHFRLKGFQTKYILKKALSRLLPQEIINRPKKGFGAPISQWINKELKTEIDKMFARQRIKKQGIFNFLTLKKMLEEHRRLKKDNRMKIWSLYMFQLWWDNYIL